MIQKENKKGQNNNKKERKNKMLNKSTQKDIHIGAPKDTIGRPTKDCPLFLLEVTGRLEGEKGSSQKK